MHAAGRVDPAGVAGRERRLEPAMLVDAGQLVQLAHGIGGQLAPFGRRVEGRHAVNRAGFVIHSAVHEAREDVQCVLHTHTRAGVAVSAQQCGVLPISQQSTFVLSSLAYHDYEGVALHDGEKPRLVRDLGDKRYLIDKVLAYDYVFRAAHHPSAADAAVHARGNTAVADFGLNSGPARAVRYLQKIAGIPETGKVSPRLMEAIADMNAAELIEDYCDKRAAFLQAIVDRDPSQSKFRGGWLARVEDVRKAAKKMAGRTVPSIKDYRDPDVVMPKAEPPDIGWRDLAGSRKMTLVQRMQAFWASLGLGGVGLSLADGMGYAKDFSQVFKDNAGLLLILGSVAGIGAGVFLARWMVEDAREGRYRVGRD